MTVSGGMAWPTSGGRRAASSAAVSGPRSTNSRRKRNGPSVWYVIGRGAFREVGRGWGGRSDVLAQDRVGEHHPVGGGVLEERQAALLLLDDDPAGLELGEHGPTGGAGPGQGEVGAQVPAGGALGDGPAVGLADAGVGREAGGGIERIRHEPLLADGE